MSPRPEHAPKFWTEETTGILAPAIEAYNNDRTMTEAQITAARAYIRQWIFSPVWTGPEIDSLRESVDLINSRASMAEWLEAAHRAGVYPL